MPGTHAGPAHDAFLAARTFRSLDGLRAISILAVIWHHTGYGRFSSTVLDERGYLGVDLFFVISGFLIVTLLLRERRRAGTISLKRFYARRTLRIFPLYYGLIAALMAASLLARPESGTRVALRHDLPFLLTYTANWVPMMSLMAIAWSLAVEEQFYLFWPPLEKLLRPPVLMAVFLVLLAVCQAVNFGFFDGLAADLGFLPQPRNKPTATSILLGVALAHAANSRTGFGWLYAVAGGRAAPFLAAAVIAAVAAVPGDIVGWHEIAVHLGMVWLVASCVIREDHAAAPLLTTPPIARLGVISYGMYLLHMIALQGAGAAMPRLGLTDALWFFALCLGFTWVMAELSFRCYETPFLRLKARFASHPPDAGPTPGSVTRVRKPPRRLSLGPPLQQPAHDTPAATPGAGTDATAS